MSLPCNCCDPRQACRAVTTQVVLDAAPVIITNGTGSPIAPLSRWSDGDIAGANFTGWTSPGVQFTDATSPVIDLAFTAPHNGITGIRSWVQGGGDLGDSDGFASWDVTVFDPIGNVLLFVTQLMGNGGAPFTTNFPVPLNNVSRVRLSNMRKTSATSGVAPLVREVDLLQTVYSTVWSCRDAKTGAITWYDVNGNLVPNSQVTTCPPPPAIVTPTALVPFVPPTGQRMSTSFFGDDGGTGENACNVIPPPSSTIGFTLAGACYDPPNTANGIMDWIPGTASIQFDYDSHGSVNSGASLFNWFVTSAGGFYNWTANATPMAAGEQRISLPNTDGSFIRVTQLPFTGPAAGALRMDGGINLRIGPAVVCIVGTYPLLFEWFK